MKKYKILIPDRSIDADVEKKVFGGRYEILTPNVKQLSEIEDRVWSSVDGILAWHDFEYKSHLLSKLSKCKGIVRIGTGYDNINLEAALKLGIIISNVPDYGTNDVADHTWGLILSMERGIVKYNRSLLQKGEWTWEKGFNLERIQNKCLGIIGFGRIGVAVARRAKAFDMEVLFYDPYVPIGIEKSLGVYRTHNLPDLAKNSDIITIHAPLTKETIGLINDSFFKNMKFGSSIFNTARGEIIELDALHIALKENKVKFAGLDVIEEEPINYNHPLFEAWVKDEAWIKDRLVITPHTAFYNEQSYNEMKQKAAEELKRIIEHESPLNKVI